MPLPRHSSVEHASPHRRHQGRDRAGHTNSGGTNGEREQTVRFTIVRTNSRTQRVNLSSFEIPQVRAESNFKIPQIRKFAASLERAIFMLRCHPGAPLHAPFRMHSVRPKGLAALRPSPLPTSQFMPRGALADRRRGAVAGCARAAARATDR